MRADKVDVNYKNYDDVTKDRSILVRFVTQWCEGCAETQSDWDALSKVWEPHPIGLVAQVFCDTEDGEPMCDVFEVAGFPSVYYGDPQSPELYTGKLDFESLAKLANEHISTLPCSVRNLDVCDDATKKIVGKLQKKSQADLEKLEKGVLDEVRLEQTKFDKVAFEIQKQYEELTTNFNAKIDKLRSESDFKWIQQVLSEMDKGDMGGVGKDEL